MESGVCPNVSDSYGLQISMAVDQNPCCNHGLDGMHEILLGHNISIPIHDSNLYNVTNEWSDAAGNYTVYYEDHNATGVLEDTRYADIAAYTALELEMTNHTKAVQEISRLNQMYNRTAVGMQDDAFTNGTEKGVYQTFKLALYLLALQKTGQHVTPELEPRIMGLQGADGGFYTGYEANGAHQGKENVETTCIVILAMRAIPGRAASIYDVTWNTTGATLHQVKVLLLSGENWTRDFQGSAYLDRDDLRNMTASQVPAGSFGSMDFTRDLTFNPWTCHTLTITIDGTSKSYDTYCPWWIKYWYLLLIPIGAVPVLAYSYYRRARHRPVLETEKKSDQDSGNEIRG